MQIICTLLQTDNHASTSSLSFYRPDALPATQPTASKHWRHVTVIQFKTGNKNTILEIISTLLHQIGIPPPTAPPGESLYIKTGNQIGGWMFSRFDHVIRGEPKYTIFMRDSIYAIARICHGNSVCPSVCLSHGWISQKRLKLGLCSFHHTVAPSL